MHLIFDLTPFAHPVGILVRAVNSESMSYFYTLIIGNASNDYVKFADDIIEILFPSRSFQ